MSKIGKKVRLSRILDRKTGRTVIIALDHGVEHGPTDFPEPVLDPRVIVRKVVKGGANAIMMHKGLARFTSKEWAGKISLILKITGRTRLMPEELAVETVVASIEDAISLGADGIAATVYVGSANEPTMLRDFGIIESKCQELGIPLLALMYPRGPKIKNRFDVQHVRYAARLGGEIGADIIKAYYTGSMKTFKEVVKSAAAPVVAAGGARRETAREALEMVKDVIRAGGIGVAIGRNVWAHPDPVGMTRAVRKIVIENASVKEALKEVKTSK